MALYYVVDAKGNVSAFPSGGSADLSNLNASNLTSGTVPLARLTGITNTQIDAAAAIAYSKLALTGSILNADVNASAAIAWSKLSKSGSSLADLATRSAADLSSGILAAARGLTILTTTSTGSQNNFNPGTLSAPIVLLRCNNASDLTLTGLVAGTDGQLLVITSIGAGNVFTSHASGSSSAGNKFTNIVTTADTPLAAGSGMALYVYDGTTAVWRLVSHAQGAWISPAFSAGEWTASGSMTWTVESGDVQTNAYLLSGRTITRAFLLNTTTVGGTAHSNLIYTPSNPYAGTVAKTLYMWAGILDNGVGVAARARVDGSGGSVNFQHYDGSNFSLATNATYIFATVQYELT